MRKRGRELTGQKLRRVLAKRVRRLSRRAAMRKEIALKRAAAISAYETTQAIEAGGA